LHIGGCHRLKVPPQRDGPIDTARFQELAQKAMEKCPPSNIIKTIVTMTVELLG
jgi:organic hydroperoxide reductase OsmC/OhrA